LFDFLDMPPRHWQRQRLLGAAPIAAPCAKFRAKRTL
jgi:hypothetical protein